ncbi:MAG: hypothetical protein RMY64_26690 [Nostoc sp. DedQUE08]|uniref:hypothetical protein n=1 Tax=Nostoc sp. DedQUE08 TaxID=3075393 RepID=UPI002AD23EE4|nr:hypothetical protein [Nostoc sp. DedQUE08]MDZ8069159.1 hypothetical protein [Nostoc sp. DedQUE08]
MSKELQEKVEHQRHILITRLRQFAEDINKEADLIEQGKNPKSTGIDLLAKATPLNAIAGYLASLTN